MTAALTPVIAIEIDEAETHGMVRDQQGQRVRQELLELVNRHILKPQAGEPHVPVEHPFDIGHFEDGRMEIIHDIWVDAGDFAAMPDTLFKLAILPLSHSVVNSSANCVNSPWLGFHAQAPTRLGGGPWPDQQMLSQRSNCHRI